jgi:quinol monooxygenase YgiN
MARRNVRIEYRLRDDVDLDAYARRLGEFVAGIRRHDPGHAYTAYQHGNDPRAFVHLGAFDESRLPALQGEAFFTAYTQALRPLCERGPEVTTLHPIASTSAREPPPSAGNPSGA